MRGISFRNRIENLDRAGFVTLVGGVYEKSPWVAEAVYDQVARGDISSISALQSAMKRVVNAATREMQLALICAHPDLAGKAAQAGAMTADSVAEQKGAGLDQLTAENYAKFQKYNADYRERFGFPFIIAVAGHTAETILASFEERLLNRKEDERETAIEQIHRIALIRMQALFEACS